MNGHAGRIETYFLESDPKVLNSGLRFRLAHSVAGRFRIASPLLQGRRELVRGTVRVISERPGIVNVVPNHFCGSVVIYYDAKQTSEEDLLGLLNGLSLADLTAVMNEPVFSVLTPHEKTSRALYSLKLSTAVVVAGVVFSGVPGMQGILAIAVFFVFWPVLQKGLHDFFENRRLSFDLVCSLLGLFGIMGGYIVSTAISVWFIYFADYISERRLLREANDDGDLDDEPGEPVENGRPSRGKRIIAGIAMLPVGLLLIPLPGPGIMVTLVALHMLSHEFSWAKKIHERLQKLGLGKSQQKSPEIPDNKPEESVIDIMPG